MNRRIDNVCTRPCGTTRARLRRLVLECLLCVAALHSQPAVAELPSAMEHDLKAAYIHNFTKFTAWPTSSFSGDTSPFIIGVLGNDSVAAALERLVKGRAVNGHPITVRIVEPSASVAELHVLYVAAPREVALAGSADAFSRAGLLTIGESERFVGLGGAIRFVVQDDRLHFEINVTAAQRAGVTTSSHLLKLARTVHKAP